VALPVGSVRTPMSGAPSQTRSERPRPARTHDRTTFTSPVIIRPLMRRTPVPRRVGTVPPPRPPAKVPPLVAPGNVPAQHTSVPPIQRRAAKPPNPRPARRTRTAAKQIDLFAIFPDLPRPPRPAESPARRTLLPGSSGVPRTDARRGGSKKASHRTTATSTGSHRRQRT
jgi:hypothetical protein